MDNEFTRIAKQLESLEARLARESASLEQHGALDGEQRLRAREAAIDLARLKEQIRHYGEGDADQHATDAADMTAVRTQLDYWTAQIDRKFKA